MACSMARSTPKASKPMSRKCWSPLLRPGDLVIMDNLGSHKGKAVRRAIRSAGAKLFFLPKYSPDLNPIEQVFAKFKHLLRNAAARTTETVLDAIGELLSDTFTPRNAPTTSQTPDISKLKKHPALGGAKTIELGKRSQSMSPGTAGGNERRIWRLAEGSFGVLRASKLQQLKGQI